MERIGLFGGTFDPVHCGHLSLAAQAVEALHLDRVLYIPAADPPHKRQTGASYEQRIAMLQLALHDASRCRISRIEAELAAPSYTVDTVLALRRQMEGDLYFLIGADSLLDLQYWHRFQELLQLTRFIVLSRPGIPLAAMQQAVAQMPGPFLPDAAQMRWLRDDGAEFAFVLNQLREDISSSAIRAQIRHGAEPLGLDKGVHEYIVGKGLYRMENICQGDIRRSAQGKKALLQEILSHSDCNEEMPRSNTQVIQWTSSGIREK